MIIHCDEQVMSNDAVVELLQRDMFCVVPDKVSKDLAVYARDWTSSGAENDSREQDPEELSREDQIYLYTAVELHHYWRARMRALALTKAYEEDYQTLMAKIELVNNACSSLRDSVALMNVLGLILDIGNYMNDATKQARGFKLSSLARLAVVKDDKNETNLADLIERIVRNQYPEWNGFLDDIQGVIDAQKVSIDALGADAQKYIDLVRNVQMSLDTGSLSDPKKFHPQDRVGQMVQRCMKDARRKADQLKLFLGEMMDTHRDIMTFYGEDPTDEAARRDFFDKLVTFMSEWKKSHEKNVKLEETRRRNEANMRRKNQQLKLGEMSAASASVGGSIPQGSGAMDSLLEKLRQAKPQTRDERDRRRRARLKDRHQVRVASGQKIQDLNEIPEVEAVLASVGQPGESVESPSSSSANQQQSETIATINTVTGEDTNLLLSPTSGLSSPNKWLNDAASSAASGEEDVADRAQRLLMGMRDGGDGGPADEALRKERKRAAEEERRARRRRREKATSTVSNVNEDDGSAGAGALTEAPTMTGQEQQQTEGLREQVRSLVSEVHGAAG